MKALSLATLTLLALTPASFAAPPEPTGAPSETAPDPAEAEPADTGEAAEDEEPEPPPRQVPDTVIKQRRDMFKTAGSVQLVDEDLLETTEYDDPATVLQQVPGIYVRGEDGYGLRPNIGIRGVTSERSQKVTLLEDGLPFGPAPYSAPAGYFFPLMTRMVGLEVLKGPAAILHGPNTIGGAVNVLTRRIPRALSGGLDLALGSAAAFDNVYGKAHGHLGSSWGWGGALAEVVHLESTGFKALDGPNPDERENTGFSRTEVMLKAEAHTDPYAECSHRFELKLGFAREVSHETYLGLSDADFEDSPYRRYAASALDRMEWRRYQAELRHTYVLGATELVTAAYWRDFSRAWRKVGAFRGGPSLEEILDDPDSAAHTTFYRILTGQEDTLDPSEALMIGTNDRRFEVLGVQSTLSHRMRTGAWKHKGELSLRLHHDSVYRLHTEDGHDMVGGRLVRDDTPRVTTLDAEASATALAAYLAYGLSGHGFTFTPGVRLEWIGTRYDGLDSNESVVLLPGIGVHKELAKNLGVFAGVYRGFSPVAPGQPDEVSPETSINWELGVRWLVPETGSTAELVGFWNDYDNLVGTCTLSSGCDPNDLDRQFNGGAVTVLGIEAAFSHRFEVGAGLGVPVRLAYTLTDATFDSAFVSDNPQFGRVEPGDHLPYIPTHQLQVQVGLKKDEVFGLNVAYTLVDAMREEAGQGDGRMTDTSHLLDVMADVSIFEGATLYARAENILMDEGIASRRPYGARPIRPFGAQLGFKWRFGTTPE
ncbi:MAG TPA: TonB-dependent receptor [Myxococcota bacterium]|nr:TonB-dependent receptor [Myxococcota bacterium]